MKTVSHSIWNDHGILPLNRNTVGKTITSEKNCTTKVSTHSHVLGNE